MTKVLIVDDDPIQLRLTSEVVNKAGFETLTVSGGAEALDALARDPSIGAMILDLVMPDLDGMAVMEAMSRRNITTPVIVQTARSSMETVVTAIRCGASDFFVKPVAPERIVISLRNALQLDALQTCVRTERARRDGTLGFSDIIAGSPEMERTLMVAMKAARSTIPVLIEGESGVGKELVARAIQGSGDRAGKPFVVVNCGAIPANLVESTLFGHVRGAFTGAVTDHPGKFREAHGGTLFLDEVGELPLDAQVKLLRAIQDGEIEPVGSSRSARVNVRVISATNRRLLNLAKSGAFREDLYYRLNVFPIYVPPLRERRSDIPALARHFLARFAAETGRPVTGLPPATLDLLHAYDWPGNIRQLENALYRAVVLCETAELRPEDFPQVMAHVAGRDEALRHAAAVPTLRAPVHIDQIQVRPAALATDASRSTADRFMNPKGELRSVADVERELIAFAVRLHRGHMSRVARDLGIGRSTLYRKLKEYGLEEEAGGIAA